MPSYPPSMTKRAWSSTSLFTVSVLTFVSPSRSSSPALLPCLFLLSFNIGPPKDNARALPHSRNPPTPVLVLMALGVGIFGCAFCGPSRIEMVADIISKSVLHTVLVCRSLVWQRLTPITIWGYQVGRNRNGSRCHGHGREMVTIIIVINGGDAVAVVVGGSIWCCLIQGLTQLVGVERTQSGVPRTARCAGKT